MPGQYRLKNCKYCGAEFRKKGVYCSQSCAASDREPTEAMRLKMKTVATEYNRTPEAIAKQKHFGTPLATLTGEDFAVDIPTIQDENDLPSGYDHAEDW